MENEDNLDDQDDLRYDNIVTHKTPEETEGMI